MDQPYFFHRNHRFSAKIGEQGRYKHFFGYTDGLVIQNNPKRGELQLVLTLDLRDPILELDFGGITQLPLVYCFQFQNGLVEFDLLANAKIKVTSLDESSYDPKGPYSRYPSRFPHLPFTLSTPVASSLKEFAKDVWQGIPDREHDKFICIVPQSDHYGVHIWQEASNYDDISTKFFVDATTRHVVAYNECG